MDTNGDGVGPPSQDAGLDVDAADVALGLDASMDDLGHGADVGAVCEGIDPLLDSDGDGIPDVLEDLNQNCLVDPGETDPYNVDSDGDGIPDGEEDVDGNGIHDAARGELDPRRADTLGDGTLDGDRARGMVCRASWAQSYANHRHILSPGQMVFAAPLQVLYQSEQSSAVLIGEPSAGHASVLVVDPNYVVGLDVLLPALRLIADLQGGSVDVGEEALGDDAGRPWRARVDIDFPSPVSAPELLAGLARALDVTVPDPSGGWLRSRRFALSVEVVRPAPAAEGAVAPRMALALSPAVNPAPWFAQTGVGAIAPAGRTGWRAWCADPELYAVSSFQVVLAVDTSPEAAPARRAVGTALAAVIDSRASAGLTTDVWITPADMHLSRGIAVQSETPARTGDELLERLGRLTFEGTDQRIWANAATRLRALQWPSVAISSAEASEVVRLVVAISADEDAEFREGETDGRDGAANLPPLPAGDARASRERYYQQLVRDSGTRLIAVANREAVSDCRWIPTQDRRASSAAAATATIDLAFRSGGHVIELCSTEVATHASRLLDGIGGAGARFRLARPPMPGTLRVAVQDEVLTIADTVQSPEGNDGVEFRIPTARPDQAVGVAYLLWSGMEDSVR